MDKTIYLPYMYYVLLLQNQGHVENVVLIVFAE